MWTGGENAYVDASSEPIILVENLPICIEANGSGARAGGFRSRGKARRHLQERHRLRLRRLLRCARHHTTGHIVGVGVGTILAVIGVGRFMALYNYLFAEPTMRLAGMPTNA